MRNYFATWTEIHNQLMQIFVYFKLNIKFDDIDSATQEGNLTITDQ